MRTGKGLFFGRTPAVESKSRDAQAEGRKWRGGYKSIMMATRLCSFCAIKVLYEDGILDTNDPRCAKFEPVIKEMLKLLKREPATNSVEVMRISHTLP